MALITNFATEDLQLLAGNPTFVAERIGKVDGARISRLLEIEELHHGSRPIVMAALAGAKPKAKPPAKAKRRRSAR